MTTATKKQKVKPSRSTFSGSKQIPVKKVQTKSDVPLRIDLGCGKNKRKDGEWVGVDEIAFDGVDIVMNLAKDKWPWKDNSVTEAYASHFVEHLEPMERVHFVNELHRVMKDPVYENGVLVQGKVSIIVPHWASQRAYGDLTHKWPPVSEFWFYYLDKDWREVNAPHNQFYTCNFLTQISYGVHQALAGRNIEYQQNALTWWKEACTDSIATLIKKI
jgi:hypothetical protein